MELTGLEPGEHYMAHVHAGRCAEDAGGDHFRFDPAGPGTPPNEIHLGFIAADDGSGAMTTVSDHTVGEDARSVVAHSMQAMDDPLVCADLAPVP